MNEKKILKITVAPDAAIIKCLTVRGRGFGLNSVLELEDGSKLDHLITAERKKDVLPRLERERANAASGAMKASFNDAGEYWGTVTRFELGLSGLRPITGSSLLAS